MRERGGREGRKGGGGREGEEREGREGGGGREGEERGEGGKKRGREGGKEEEEGRNKGESSCQPIRPLATLQPSGTLPSSACQGSLQTSGTSCHWDVML